MHWIITAGSQLQLSSALHESFEDKAIDAVSSNLRVVLPERTAGYDCRIIERPSGSDCIETKCPICLTMLCNPQRLTCCNYNYCEACIETAEKVERRCPMCIQEVFSIIPNRALKSSLNQYTVTCTYEREGCKWIGKLGELDEHLNENPKYGEELTGCEFVRLECTNCHECFQRRGTTSEHVDVSCFEQPCYEKDQDFINAWRLIFETLIALILAKKLTQELKDHTDGRSVRLAHELDDILAGSSKKPSQKLKDDTTGLDQELGDTGDVVVERFKKLSRGFTIIDDVLAEMLSLKLKEDTAGRLVGPDQECDITGTVHTIKNLPSRVINSIQIGDANKLSQMLKDDTVRRLVGLDEGSEVTGTVPAKEHKDVTAQRLLGLDEDCDVTGTIHAINLLYHRPSIFQINKLSQMLKDVTPGRSVGLSDDTGDAQAVNFKNLLSHVLNIIGDLANRLSQMFKNANSRKLVRLDQGLDVTGDVPAVNLLSRVFNIIGDVLPDKLSQKLNDVTARRLVRLAQKLSDVLDENFNNLLSRMFNISGDVHPDKLS